MPPGRYALAVLKAFNDPARVVVVQLVLLPPTVTVAVSVVLTDALVVMRTFKVWPDVMEPDVAHAPPLILISEVAAPETETAKLPPEHPENVIVAGLRVVFTEVARD